MSQCKVFLENYGGTYYSGSEIRGRLECYFKDETTVRAVKIRLKCKEHTDWLGTETYTDHQDNNRSKTRTVQYSGDHYVLYMEKILFGSESGSQSVPPGRNVYPFQFILPDNIPSSYNGPYGGISYQIKGIVDRPMRTDYEDRFIFNVKSPIDFSKLSSNLQEPSTYSDEKTVCCWCCRGGNVSMDVELPRTGFCVGETVDFKINVTNLSNSNVDKLKVKLTKYLKFKASTPRHESKDVEEEILSIIEHGVGAHGQHSYDMQLVIPEYLEVPNFAACDLFDSRYKMEVSCNMPSCVLDLDVMLSVTLGHVRSQESRPGFNAAQIGGDYPPPPFPGSGYHPPVGGYPPSPYPPVQGMSYPSAPGFSDKPGYPGGPPTAPYPVATNPKAQEAASAPSAPYLGPPSEMPPPSYSQVQQNMPPYPPQ